MAISALPAHVLAIVAGYEPGSWVNAIEFTYTEEEAIESSRLIEITTNTLAMDNNLKALFNAFLSSRLAFGYALKGAALNMNKAQQPRMYAKLCDLLINSPSFFDESERIFAIECVNAKSCPTSLTTPDPIRKLLNNRKLTLNLFGLVQELQFLTSSSTQLSQEIACFPSLTHIYFNKVKGTLRGPADLTRLKCLEVVDITGSGLKITDLLVAYKIRVLDEDHPLGIELAPPPSVNSRTCVIL